MTQHSVRLLDLPNHQTDIEPIVARLTAFHRRLKARRALQLYFRAWRKREEAAKRRGLPPQPFTRSDIRRWKVPDPSRALAAKIRRRAGVLVKRREEANGLQHLKDKERERLDRIRGEVPAVTIETEQRADELAAAIQEEMPWMAQATEVAWHAFRRSWRLGQPVRIGPVLLIGDPGIGKTAWARQLAERLQAPSCMIDAAQGRASFSLVGTERGWSSSQPGIPLQTIIDSRCANPVVIVDEVEKASSPRSTSGHLVAFLPALLGLLEPSSAAAWDCPYYRVTLDLSHVSWVLTANTVGGLTGPVLSRSRVLHMRNPTTAELQDFASRQGRTRGLESPAVEAVVETIARLPDRLRSRFSLRDVIRMLERAEDLACKPMLH